MPGPKTNEREGTRAVLRHARMSPSKVREVLDLVRNRPVHEAEDILRFSERDAAFTVNKLLHSAVANAEHNEGLDPEELYISACFADEGTTIKRWRPRARGRATRIRKRTTHITVIVSRMPTENLERLRARRQAEQLAQRARRVAGARASEGDTRTRAERRRRSPVEPEAEEFTESAEDQAESGSPQATEAGRLLAEEEDAGIVDTTAGAVAANEAADADVTDADEADADAANAGSETSNVDTTEEKDS